MKKIYIIGAVAVLFAACRPSINIDKKASAGNVDFTNYMAIGNSLTSGYSDGSLTVSGQLNSYPQRLFEQFSLIPVHGAVGQFVQPTLVSDNGWPGPKLVLANIYSPCTLDSSLGAIRTTDPLDSAGDYQYAGINGRQINNLGVPGIRVADYKFAGYAALNPYAKRFYFSAAGSPLDELRTRVTNLGPTFFTMWLGANDVLGYAMHGGQGRGDGLATPIAPNLYNTIDITPTTFFDTCYDAALNVAISTGASGALINIPDITSIPYFTTVPANGLILTRQGQADSLTALYSSLAIKPIFQVGANYFMIKDNGNVTRQAVPGELILLTVPQDSIACKGWGSTVAIPDTFVLTTDEIQYIRQATTAYNNYIQLEANLHHLCYVDMATFFTTLPSGLVFNGIKYNTQFVTGGAFSLDGIHPTQRGYALVANEIIRNINAFYKSNVPSIDVNKYKGVTFP